MKFSRLASFCSIALALVLMLGVGIGMSAQGKGRGNPPANPGRGGQPTTNPGTETRTTTTTNRTTTNGSDNSMGTTKSQMPSDTELKRYTGISKKLNTTPDALNTQFQTALAANPKLNFGQFVAANVVASNLSGRFPNVTTDAILSGLASGKSLGQTLQSLGVDSATSKTAEKDAKKQIKDSQKSP